ncbi:putative replication protein [Escherichia coli]|uniref:ATP-binding protein n=1 Tax=Escherichia coli TaxID=562 RepID=UPI000BE1E6DF|nr:ATP-binding protein [Escherichia coli]UMT13018.1 DNA replication protein DnaC [Escherichia coli]CAD5624949.1 putative replication protein [Escherichia coli]CAD5876306.1 putative replication protein [Escherichia coli]CAD6100105.1 putative replication protein [Escherichia coli]
MKDIATVAVGVLERIRRLAPEHVPVPYSTTEEWREWQLAEGRKYCEEINRRNRQLRVEKILNRSGIQPLHRKCSFANYQVRNDGQKHALSQAKSIAEEMITGYTNFVFSGNPGTGKNHLAAAVGNRLLKAGKSVIVVTVADVMSALHASYDDGLSGEKFLRELCEVDLLVLDEIGIQRETKNEQVVLHQIVDRRTASLRSVGMLTNLNHAAMSTLLGERIMDRMTMNGGRWVSFNWESWRPNVSHLSVAK